MYYFNTSLLEKTTLIISFTIFVVFIFFVFLKTKKDRKININHIFIAALFILIYSICGAIRPFTWLSNVGETAGLLLGTSFAYFFYDEIFLYNTPNRNIWKTDIFLVGLSATII